VHGTLARASLNVGSALVVASQDIAFGDVNGDGRSDVTVAAGLPGSTINGPDGNDSEALAEPRVGELWSWARRADVGMLLALDAACVHAPTITSPRIVHAMCDVRVSTGNSRSVRVERAVALRHAR
jgi:hypothetical protein